MGKRRTSNPQPPPLRTLHVSLVVDEQLDLHGFTAEAAERRLEGFFDMHAMRSPGSVVRVITGRGARSAGPAVLMSVVRDALTGWLAHRVEDWAVDVGGGAYLVKVRG
jgi:DNA-nicking Smr family endonuclease